MHRAILEHVGEDNTLERLASGSTDSSSAEAEGTSPLLEAASFFFLIFRLGGISCSQQCTELDHTKRQAAYKKGADNKKIIPVRIIIWVGQ